MIVFFFLHLLVHPIYANFRTEGAKSAKGGPLPEATPTESDRRILPDLVGFGQNWSDLVGIGRYWSDLVLIFVKFGRNRSELVRIGRIWSDSVGFGRSGRIRSDLVVFGRSSFWEGT